MRIFITVLLAILASNVFADEITCYNTGRVIYHEDVKNIDYTYDGFYIFTEKKTNKTVILSGDCIIKLSSTQ